MRLDILPSKQFRKDLKKARKRGLPMGQLEIVVETLVDGNPLDAKYRDHELTGGYHGFRECHVMPDWLLVYRVEEKALELFLFRTGSHSDLF